MVSPVSDIERLREEIGADAETHVTLTVLVGNTLCCIAIARRSELFDIGANLKEEDLPSLAENLGICSLSRLKYHYLDPQPHIMEFRHADSNEFVVTNAEEVLRDRTKTQVWDTEIVGRAFKEAPDLECVSLLLEIPPSKEARLREAYPEIFPCLFVKRGTTCSFEDIEANDASFVSLSETRSTDVEAMIARLSAPRRYEPPADEVNVKRLRACQGVLGETFSEFFVPSGSQPAIDADYAPVESTLEFDHFAFVDTVQEELPSIERLGASQRMRVQSLVIGKVYLMPPGFAFSRQEIAQYDMHRSWPFKLFEREPKKPMCAYRPKADFCYTSMDSIMPLVIVKFATSSHESDRWDVLTEAIALARLGNLLLKKAERPYVTMAIYVNEKSVAERYLVYQPEASNLHVEILRNDFALGDADSGRRFLLQLYNFEHEIARQTNKFDRSVFRKLKGLMEDIKYLDVERRSSGESSSSEDIQALEDRAAGHRRKWDTIQDAVDASEDMQQTMKDWGLQDILFIPLGHPFTAEVFPRGDSDSDGQYYIKYIHPHEDEEVKILSELATHDSPDNHAIRFTAIQKFDDGGILLLFKNAGTSLDYCEDISEPLSSIATQFLRGIAFLHEHNVAHCDIKPSNILIDTTTGRVTIIDFGLAAYNVWKIEGVRGTEGWTAPEVGKERFYKPCPADVWSAGKVLKVICWKYARREEEVQIALMRLADTMMASDPGKRPDMKGVVKTLESVVGRTHV